MPNTITETKTDTKFDLAAIQQALRENKIDGWLFYDHHHRDPLAYSILGLDPNMHVTRRWYYFIPAQGEPKKLVHRIESFRLDTLPGTKTAYSSWQELESQLQTLLTGATKIAMQYSPRNAIMYISMVDAGTIELLRDLGKQIVSSADLVSQFEAVLTDEQLATHYIAQEKIDQILDAAWKEIGTRARNGGTDEHAMVQYLQQAMARENLVPPHPQRRLRPHRHLGTTRQPAYLRLVRHHLDRRRRPRAHRARATHLLHRPRRPRRLHQARTRRLRRQPTHRRLAGRRRCPQRHPQSRLRRRLHPPHRPQHRARHPRQRRAPRQSRNPRRAPPSAQHLLLRRTRPLLPRRIRSPQ